jgi:hypothetical protein
MGKGLYRQQTGLVNYLNAFQPEESPEQARDGRFQNDKGEEKMTRGRITRGNTGSPVDWQTGRNVFQAVRLFMG